MPAPHCKRVAVGIEKLAVKPLEGVADADHEIDGACKLRVEDRRAAPRHHVDTEMWR